MVDYVKNKGIRTVIFTSGVKYRNPLSEEEKTYYETSKSRDINLVLEHEPDNKRLITNIEKYYNNFLNPPTFSCITKEELASLKNMGLDKIVFDFQAYELETDQCLMGRKNNFQQALFNSLFNAAIVGLDVDVHFIPMQPNYKEILDILELLEIVGIKNISLLNFVPQGRGKENATNLQLSEKQLQEFFEILSNASKIYSGNVRIGIPLQGENTHKCTAGLEKIDIKYDGTILPCPAFKELTKKEYEKYGIKLYNIYEHLEQVHIPGKGTRKDTLCKRVYKYRST